MIAAGASLDACGGESSREARAGGDTLLDPSADPDGGVRNGALGVDPDTETTFLLQARVGAGGSVERALVAVRPDDGGVQVLERPQGSALTRLLFLRDGVLVVRAEESGSSLRLYDPRTLALRLSQRAPRAYRRARVSPSRRFVIADDSGYSSAGFALIEHDSLRSIQVQSRSYWMEASWHHTSDRLVAAVAQSSENSATMRFVVYDVAQVQREGYPDQEPLWRSPILDVSVPGVVPHYLGTREITVSPDDRFAVIPVSEFGWELGSGRTAQLLVLDLQSGSVARIDDAFGPVGITPDGSTLVAHRGRDDMPGQSELVLIDRATLTRIVVPLPFAGDPIYHTTRRGSRVLISSQSYPVGFYLYDLAMQRLTFVPGVWASLGDFVVREQADEVYALDRGLLRLSLSAARSERVNLGWTPAHLNYLPQRDLLVLDAPATNSLRFWSPTLRETVRDVPLPPLP